MTNLNCNVIKDLLPLYVDNLTSEDSNKLIQAHLQDCSICNRELENFKKTTETVLPVNFNPTGIDFMKKYNRYRRSLIIALVALSVCFVTVLALFLVPVTISNEYLHLTDVIEAPMNSNGEAQSTYTVTIEYPTIVDANLTVDPNSENDELRVYYRTNLLGFLQLNCCETTYCSAVYVIDNTSTLLFCDNQSEQLIFNESMDPTNVTEDSKVTPYLNFIF